MSGVEVGSKIRSENGDIFTVEWNNGCGWYYCKLNCEDKGDYALVKRSINSKKEVIFTIKYRANYSRGYLL
jgi:hypothetical protein